MLTTETTLREWLASERRATIEALTRVYPEPPPVNTAHWLVRRYVDEGEILHTSSTNVRLVYDLRMRRHTIMKILESQRVSNPREVARFYEEARITSVLDHPHAPPIYDQGEDDERTPFFTMKLVDGPTLHEHLETDYSPVDTARLYPLIEAVMRACEVVAQAHIRGFVHCDIRPANLTRSPQGQVYLLEWSAARLLPGYVLPDVDVNARGAEAAWGEPTQSMSHLSAQVAYMAPEQAVGELNKIDQRTDVFGIGATLYHVLTGRPPYPGPTLRQYLEQARDAIIPPPWEVVKEFAWPRKLGHVVMRALSADPAARQPSAEALKREIENALRGGGDADPRVFKPGALLMREGEEGSAAYVIIKGRCLVFKTIDGGRVPIRELGPGEVVGETAIFSAKPRTASVEAMDQVTASVITRTSLEEEMGRTIWLGYLVKALAQRFRDVDARAMTAEQARDEAELAREILRAMIKKGAARVSWSPLRAMLSREFKRTGPETASIAARIPFLRIDEMRGEIELVEPQPIELK